MTKIFDMFIAVVLVLAAALIYNYSIGNNKFIENFQLSSFKFKNKSDCDDYVIRNSIFIEKTKVGIYACAFAFDTRNNNYVNFGKCVVNKYNSIENDSSGTKTLSQCAQETNARELAYTLNKQFDSVARMEEKLAEERQKIEFERRNTVIPGQLMSNGLPYGDGPIIINNNGNLMPCIKMGISIDC